MKKALLIATFSIIAIATCLAIIWGSNLDHRYDLNMTDDAPYTFCQVACLQEDGIIVDMVDAKDAEGKYLGYVYIKNISKQLEIMPLDTVVLEYDLSDLTPADVAFVDFWGESRVYSYVLENPKSIRLTTPGEPTYG